MHQTKLPVQCSAASPRPGGTGRLRRLPPYEGQLHAARSRWRIFGVQTHIWARL